jgi:hypothetical protein
VERIHGGAVRGRGVFFEHGGIDEAMHDSVGVTRMGDNGRKGMYCDGHEEGSASDFAVGAASMVRGWVASGRGIRTRRDTAEGIE